MKFYIFNYFTVASAVSELKMFQDVDVCSHASNSAFKERRISPTAVKHQWKAPAQVLNTWSH